MTETPVVCAICRRAILGGPISAAILRRRATGNEFVPVAEVRYVRAVGKGVEFESLDGERWFEYLSIADVVAEHADAFARVSRDLAVRISAIVAVHRLDMPGGRQYALELAGGERHTVARRRWGVVREQLGMAHRHVGARVRS